MTGDKDGGGTAPPKGSATPRVESGTAKSKPDGLGDQILLGRTAIPVELQLKRNPDERDLYLVELNVLHRGGLKAAEARFLAIWSEVLPSSAEKPPLRVGKTYYRCNVSVNEVRKLTERDEQRNPKEQAIYRIWPDFPIKALIDRSTATVKADAALRSYLASGGGITWAVIDSGIDSSHPHFGQLPSEGGFKHHLLLNDDVIELHRDYSNPDLDDPDLDPAPALAPEVAEGNRQRLVGQHAEGALTDGLGHGTHVAGIIAGGLPEHDMGAEPRVFERRLEIDEEGRRKPDSIVERTARVGEFSRLHGVAPNCNLISLKVLDAEGKGRSSDVIRALAYIREVLNNNPRLVRVHGVNLSVGYDFDAKMFACGQSPLCVEVDRLVQAGVVVVAAAGNTGFGQVASIERSTTVGLSNTINDPGNAALAITVGATHRDAPHTYGVSYFSSKGPTGDGRLKPDIVAPGERITSCAAGSYLKRVQDGLASTDQPGLASPQPGSPVADALAAARETEGGKATPGEGGQQAAVDLAASSAPQTDLATAVSKPRPVAAYVDEDGTSMAAPHVSGAIAAFLSIRPEFVGKPLEVKRIFLESATPLGRERYFEGHGLVDLMRAIQSV